MNLVILALIISLIVGVFGGYFGSFSGPWTEYAPGGGIGVAIVILIGVRIFGGLALPSDDLSKRCSIKQLGGFVSREPVATFLCTGCSRNTLFH